jgi:RNA polymerase sigma-70 factor (ECF subfamily)
MIVPKSCFWRNFGNKQQLATTFHCCPSDESELPVPDPWPDIIHSHVGHVVRSIRRIVGNDHDAEDIAQDVFLEAYQIAKKTQVLNWGGFLRRLATRRAIDRLRARATRRLAKSNTELGNISDRTPEPYQNLVAAELAERLRSAISQLPEMQAEIFAMRYLDEMSYERIADLLAISANAVGLALNKARSRLMTLLANGA